MLLTQRESQIKRDRLAIAQKSFASVCRAWTNLTKMKYSTTIHDNPSISGGSFFFLVAVAAYMLLSVSWGPFIDQTSELTDHRLFWRVYDRPSAMCQAHGTLGFVDGD